jgi:type IV pilus assembly protein PilM
MHWRDAMKLRPKKKTAALVGVDIDARSVAAVELGDGGRIAKVGTEPLRPESFNEGLVTDPDAVAAALRALFAREGFSKQVRLALANQRVAFRTVRLPVIEDPAQLQAAVRFQAQEQIPMPLESAVLDHQVIGGSVSEEGNRQIDVAVVAAREDSVTALLEAARQAGLEPLGVDLAAFGMIRALASDAGRSANGNGDGVSSDDGEFVQAVLYCSLGDQTNLAIARDRACLFSRVAQFGVREVADGLASDTGLSAEHAEQWLLHAGLIAPLDQVEGDPDTAAKARSTLEGAVGKVTDELRLSLDYYGSQDGAIPVGDVVLCGWGSAIPGLADRLGEELARPVFARRPGALAGLPDVQAARLTLPYGLAMEH